MSARDSISSVLNGRDHKIERSDSSISGVTTRSENAVLKMVWRDIDFSELTERGANIFANIESIDIVFTSKERAENKERSGLREKGKKRKEIVVCVFP